MKKTVLLFLFPSILLLGSCAWLYPHIPTGGGSAGQFTAVVSQVTADAGTQDLTVVITVTNRGTNVTRHIGSSASGTMAVDINGNTIKPRSSGVILDFPTGVPVKVTIDRFGPIMPGTPMLRTLRVSLGNANEIVEFRNVPIVW
jgi:hypothetical protein